MTLPSGSIPSERACHLLKQSLSILFERLFDGTMFSQASPYSGQRCFQYVVLVSNSSKLSGLALASNHFLRASPSIVPWDVSSRARDSING